MNKGMKPRMGRHPIPLPGGMSPEAHEARRKSLGLSCRKYAKSIGIRADAASKAQEIRRVLGVLSNGVRETPDEHAAAVSMGRRGGKKGGVARASSLSPERRTELASKAAMARWHPELNGVVRDVRQSST